MAGETTYDKAAPAARVVSPEDKALSADWLKRIESALARKGIKEAHKQFEENRKLLRGIDSNGKRMPANLYFANLASMRPQVYAKDPEYACAPAPGVPENQLKVMRKFCQTSEAVLSEYLVRRTRLKKRSKRLLTSAYTTSVGWFKLCWQEDKRNDPLITNQIKDVQDNMQRIEALQKDIADPQAGANADLDKAKLEATLKGLQEKQEVTVARGLTLDFVMSEDVIILDTSVRELGDYERSSAIAHRVWMSRDAYKIRFQYAADKGKSYSEQPGGTPSSDISPGDRKTDLLCVYEIWDQDSNRLFCVCDGEEGFCEEPSSPDWTGKRWYPFFAMAFNEIEGKFYPLSDIELTQPQIEEINQTAVDFKRDRKASLPLNVARKGGSLTDADLTNLKNREGSDIVLVEGVGNQPLSNDIWSGQLAQIKPENYDTTQARSFMEQIVGGGDAARGSVLKAKTATEAEILSQGLRTRSAERQDTMEDLLTELGSYALQILLRKLTPEEVQKIAGPDNAWPTLSADQVFDLMTVEVRGGSTGKPDRLQEQDRWTKLLPVIEKTVEQVAELREKGQNSLAEALIELTRETLRRFDERLDIEQYLPPPPEEGQPNPEQLAQENMQLKQKLQEVMTESSDMKNKLDKGYITAAAGVATSQNPAAGAQAFGAVMQTLETGAAPPGMMPAGPPPIDPAVHQQLIDEHSQLQQQLADKSGEMNADIEKTRINAVRDVEVTKVKAPIEASAKVEAARITAEASERAKASAAAEKPTEDPNEGVLKQIAVMHEGLKAVHEKLSTPKKTKLVHHRGPDGKIAASEIVEEGTT